MIKQAKRKVHPFVYMVIASVLTGLIAWGYHEYFNGITFMPSITESKRVENAADEIIKKQSNIVAVQIVRVVLEKNSRYITYTAIKDPEVRKIYDNFLADRIIAQVPFFTDDHVQNMRMVSILNHEFNCSPFADTISYKYAPEAGKHVSYVCAVSIPPYYGKFVGIVGVFFRNPPTDLDKELIRVEMVKLAQLVFDTAED